MWSPEAEDPVGDICQIGDAQEGHLELEVPVLSHFCQAFYLHPEVRHGHQGSSHPSFLSLSLHRLDPLCHPCLVIAEPQAGPEVTCVLSLPGISRPRRYSQALLTSASADFRPQGCGFRAGLHVSRVRLKLYKRRLRTQTKMCGGGGYGGGAGWTSHISLLSHDLRRAEVQGTQGV